MQPTLGPQYDRHGRNMKINPFLKEIHLSKVADKW